MRKLQFKKVKSAYQLLGSWLSNNTSATAGAAIIIALGSVFIDFRKEQRYDYQDLLKEKRMETERLRQIEQDCFKQMLKHSQEIADLKIEMVRLQATQTNK